MHRKFKRFYVQPEKYLQRSKEINLFINLNHESNFGFQRFDREIQTLRRNL